MIPSYYLTFKLEDQYYAISVFSVKHVIRAVRLTHLKEAPELLAGLINMRGEIIPVIDIRKQLRLQKKNLFISDRVVIAETSVSTIGFITDAVTGVMELSPQAYEPPEDVFPGLEKYIRGVARFNNLTILIYDIDALFPPQDMADIINNVKNLKERQ